MAYLLEFDERALKEWRKLGATVREQLKKKLAQVLIQGLKPINYEGCLTATS